MKFVFVRHGETDYNKRKVMTGQYDAPLNEEGREQARLEMEKLQNNFDVIFSSSLSRARETADIINKKLNLPIIITDLITERDFGSLVGKTWDEMEKLIPDARKVDKEQKYDYRPFGGESAEEVSARLSKFIEETKTGPYKNPLVVCHGGIIRMLYYRENKEFDHIENATAQEFDL